MATSVLGNMGGESFAENISGKVLVKSGTIANQYDIAPDNISIKGSGIASVRFVYTGGTQSEIQNTMDAFCIKVDGITLHDYEHFKDYRRGYAYGYGYSRTYTPDEQMSYHTSNTTKVVDECHFDFLTIPFSKSIEIGFLNGRPLGYGWYVPGDIASVLVWQDED